MKKVILILLAVTMGATSVFATEGDLIDFGKCKLVVKGVKQIDGFTGEKGEFIQPSRRNTRFVEVELSIEAYAAGEFGLYPAMFGSMFIYRGVATVVQAVAIGTKITDKESGETREYWYNEPEVSIILGVESGDTFSKYIVLEIPKEVEEFHLQGPMSIQQLSLRAG